MPDTSTSVPNPFFGIADAGQFATSRHDSIGQLLRPFPQFDNVNMTQSTGAHSLYHAAIFQIRKRVDRLVGRHSSATPTAG